jgi:hypothetical protein
MLLAQETTNSGAGGALILWYIVLYVIFALPLFFVFKKAGSDMAWGAFVPIFSIYVLLKVVGRPGWWLVLYIIPIVSLIILIIVWNDLSKSFGHGAGFTVGLIFLPWIFLAILAWGSSTYRGPSAPSAGGMVAAPPPPPPITS